MRRLPWGTANLLVLRAVAAGWRYGFEIMEATGLQSGQVYRALHKLRESGLVRSAWEDPRVGVREGRPRRRFYSITTAGLADLDRAAAASAEFARSVTPVLGQRDPADRANLRPSPHDA